MKRPEITVVISLCDKADVKGPVEVAGYGDGGSEVCVSGKVADLRFTVNGEDEFGLSIQPDGRLVITSYQGGYQTYVPQNLNLHPLRPWKDK